MVRSTNSQRCTRLHLIHRLRPRERSGCATGETASVQLILEANAEVRTFVITSGRSTLANAFVFVYGGVAMRVATTGADGRASMHVPSSEANAELAIF
jgi:hypothetical protein